MSLQTWQELYSTAQADGSALSNSSSRTSILPTQAKYTLPAGFFNAPGKAIRVTALGRISNIVTTPGTLTLDIGIGSVNTAFTSGALSLNTTAKTNVTWKLQVLATCRAVGSGTSANLMGIGEFVTESNVGATAGQPLLIFLPASAPAVGTGFDSTIANTLDLAATFSIANSGNAMTLHEFFLEALN